jgi:hypothetical protein
MGIRTRSFANNILSGGVFDATDLDGALPSSNIADASVTNITAVPALVATTTVASDPPSPNAGQIWYNSTDRVLRGYKASPVASWASGGNLNTGRRNMFGMGVGTNTAGLQFGGRITSTATNIGNTESYNGSAWTEVNDLNTARNIAGGAGTQTAALGFGNYLPPATGGAQTESWDGTSWTELNDLNVARGYFSGNGTQTSALAVDGYVSTMLNNVESWNGTSWTTVATTNTTADSRFHGGASNTSAVVSGGYDGGSPTLTSNTETWDGSSWTEVNNSPAVTRGNSGGGTATLALMVGGRSDPTSYLTNATKWDGTNWTELADLSTGRENHGGDGGVTASFVAGGNAGPPTDFTSTEIFEYALATTTLGAS